MMNPIELCRLVEDRYRRFLTTTYRFSDPEFDRSFSEALSGQHLAKGPFLEISPQFLKGRSPETLFQTLLGHSPDEGFLSSVQGKRNLYLHQDKAIEKVFNRKNIIVSTGTGSGKTESFLFPILLHLYQEFERGTLGPGVRAMILYPLNALANDQRDRLGSIAKALKESGSSFQFSFGQYIGETPQDVNDVSRQAERAVQDRKTYELVFREEMRKNPPNILLTNFSMLEYLLLRPDDSPLFSGSSARNWTFIVLDEVHQYRGSVGIEMSMLLARLKQRLREGGKSDSFRCIGTSATLADGEQGYPAVANFASTLFGEPFSTESIISGTTEAISGGTGKVLPCDAYLELASALREPAKLRDRMESAVQELGDEKGTEHLPSERLMGEILLRDERTTRLRKAVNGNPTEIHNLACAVFPESDEESCSEYLGALIECLSWARHPETGDPLGLPRYHFFLRALEGAFVTYLPEKKVFIERISRTGEGMVFEVALCRECGQHYFVGRLVSNENMSWLAEASRDPGNYEVDYFRPLTKGCDEEQEITDDEQETSPDDDVEEGTLCLVCGAYEPFGMPACGHDPKAQIRVIKETHSDDHRKNDRAFRCGACGASSNTTPIRAVVSGSDAPQAVVSTTLYEALPADRKKTLAFADGRQTAAFFAWYLENTYFDIFRRNLLFLASQKLKDLQEGASPDDLVQEMIRLGTGMKLFKKTATSQEKRKDCWTWLLQEFFGTTRRVSLEGVGLLRWYMELPDTLEVPASMLGAPFNFSSDEARDLIRFCLDTFRRQNAVEFSGATDNQVDWSNVGLGIEQKSMIFGSAGGTKGVLSWLGSGSARFKTIQKLLMTRGMEPTEAKKQTGMILRAIWKAVVEWDQSEPSSDDDRILLASQRGSRLNLRWFRGVCMEGKDLFRCDTCGQVQYTPFLGLCERAGCDGSVELVSGDVLAENHYRRLYQGRLPGMMRVEEHTAQLNHESARQFQKDFKDGKIHLLSCSTTFEMGVDLGDLDNVFLRNVPPEAFNYAQRVGRAGRRQGFPGIAITFCLRSPHDLYHFSDPLNIIRGAIRPPVLKVVNEKILERHLVAVILSHYFRYNPERFRSVESFFAPDPANPVTVQEMHRHVMNHYREIRDSLQAILPADSEIRQSVTDGNEWVETVCGKNSRLFEAQAVFCSDLKAIEEYETLASRERRYGDAQWAMKMKSTLLKDSPLSFLSRQAAIPKYGFPVDVVDLDTRWAKASTKGARVELQRDLSIAISEFAPTAEVIANKLAWRSHSLKKAAGKEWERRHYKYCLEHNCFLRWCEGELEPELPCGDEGRRGTYLIPSFGFTVSRQDDQKEPRRKPERMFATRPFFGGKLGCRPGTPEEILLFDPENPLIQLRPAQPGRMVILCEGKKGNSFYICEQCGYGDTRPPSRKRGGALASHENYLGRECHGQMNAYALGHEFITDVLEVRMLRGPKKTTSVLDLAYSIAYALLEGAAETLSVPSSDLNVTVGSVTSNVLIPPILLYDAVPGGAGIVSSLEQTDLMKESLAKALKRVSGSCGCDPNTSCYGCLRSYRNQYLHGSLSRGLAAEYLSFLLEEI
jgi:superfamily II DNA or RNA helicase